MHLRTIFAALVLAAASTAPLLAQRQTESAPVGPTRRALRHQLEVARRVPVTIALVDQFPADAGNVPGVILRRSGTAPYDVILLRRADATGAQLAGAILHLMVVRERSGDTAQVDGTFRLPTANRGPRAWDRTELVVAERIVGRLRHAEVRDIPGVGRVHAREIFLPSRSMRVAGRQRAQAGK